jgi:N-acetylglucosamine-6-sulfatase
MVRRMFSVIRLAGHLAVLATVVGSPGFLAQGLGAANRSVTKVDGEAPRNIIFVLADDHRFDAMGFAGHPFLKTPNLDRMAKGGAWFPNAFVTTSLCSQTVQAL